MKKIKLGDVICNGLGDFTDPFEVPADVNYLEVANGYWFRARSPFADALAADSKINKLIAEYIMPSLYDKVIALADCDADEDEVYAIKERSYRSILAYLFKTKEVHEKIIDASEVELMKTVGTITKNYFNETPQYPDPDLDNHVTTYSKTETGNDVATPAARLDEIRRLYEDEYRNWYNDFYNSFIMIL